MKKEKDDDDNHNNMSNNPSSQLLVWPKTVHKNDRRRPKIQKMGWVLGWKYTSSFHNARPCDTFLCAGILNRSKSRDDYQQTIKHLRNIYRDNTLLQSLEIIAYWTIENKNIPNEKELSPINVISNERGYPWFPSSSYSDDDKCRGHRQLLYYLQDKDNDFDHLHSEYGGDKAINWSLLLHRINHSREILEIVQSGNLETLPKVRTTEAPVEHTTAPTTDQRKSASKRLERFFLTQSLTLQHFRQITFEKSFLYSIAAFRCGSNLYECRHCGKASIISSRSESSKLFISKCNQFILSVFDMCLGFLVGICLLALWYYQPNFTLYHIQVKRYFFQLLLDKVEWLEEFPVGFKLNVKLTNNLGSEIRNMLRIHKQLLVATTWDPQIYQNVLLPLLSGISLLFGWSGFLAVLIDLTRYELIHTVILANCFRNLYRAELYLLSALWRLFRGKKRNILRKRTDSMQYDSMQLLVGTIAFCICIFLWTTILVYYTFFTVWNISMQIFIACLWVVYMFTRSVPWASLWFRSTRLNWFAKDTYSKTLLNDDSFNLSVTRLGTVSHSHISILIHPLALHLKHLSKWLLDLVLEALLPRVSNSAPCSIPLSLFMETFATTTIKESSEN
jgi:hypothetical protein